MCLNPVKTENGMVSCRNCWQCRQTKVDDWVGRNIAESKFAKASHVITLTYGQDRTTGATDHLRAAVLTYSDVQKFLKLLRADGYPVRYFAVGEYGTLKGRAHWHIICYWQKRVPEHVLRENFMQKHWPHGWSYWDKSSPEAIRYACKYLLKNPENDEQQNFGPMPSKKPPLGAVFFKQLADRYIEQRLSPQDLKYSFPDVRRMPRPQNANSTNIEKRPEIVSFNMHGTTAENFLSYFYSKYQEVHGDTPPKTELLYNWLDKRLDAYLSEGRPPLMEVRKRGIVPIRPPFNGSEPKFSEKMNCYYSDHKDGYRLYYSTDSEGNAVWHEKVAPKAETEAKRSQAQTGRTSERTNPYQGSKDGNPSAS